MRFANPEMFVLLLLVLPLFYLYFKKRVGSQMLYSSVQGLSKFANTSRMIFRHIPFFLLIAAFILWVVALARPQIGHSLKEVHTEGVDIVLMLDTSNSMEARDLEFQSTQRTRLEIAKEVVASFIEKRPNDRIGLVVFGEYAFTQCPLTLDHGVLLSFLKTIKIGHAGGNSTAIGDGLGTAVKRLEKSNAKSKVLILLTDGRNNSGELSPKRAAQLANTFNIKTYTIGVGKRGKAPFFEQTLFGRRVRYEQVDIDENTLKQVAQVTGGKYYRATDKETLEKIYATIDELEKVEIKVTEHMEFNERAVPFIVTGIVFILLSIILSGTILRKVP